MQRRGPGAPCGVRTEAGPVVQLTATTMHTFLEENARGLTIVDFLTTWCGPCKVSMLHRASPAAAAAYPTTLCASVDG